MADAERIDAPAERAAEWEINREFARQWRCPSAGHTPADHVTQLCEDARTTIDDVERLTKVKGCTTCPNHYTKIPWVLRVWKLRTQRDKQMLPVVRPRLTAIEVACMDAIDAATNAREEYEWKQQMKAHEKK